MQAVHTNFAGADFSNADLRGSVLVEADLRGAKNLTADQLGTAQLASAIKLDVSLEEEMKRRFPSLIAARFGAWAHSSKGYNNL